MILCFYLHHQTRISIIVITIDSIRTFQKLAAETPAGLMKLTVLNLSVESNDRVAAAITWLLANSHTICAAEWG